MSIPERIFNISKSYLNSVRDRIDNELAERELQAATDAQVAGLPPTDDSSPEAMIRRAEARIAALRREAEARTAEGRAAQTPPQSGTTSQTPEATAAQNADPNASDFRILGVPIGSDFATVQAAYEKLAQRCDPRRFPDGSVEQKEAEKILAKINVSFDALKKRLDPTVTRFDKLEFE